MTQCEVVCVNTELKSSAQKSFPAKNRICWCKYKPCFFRYLPFLIRQQFKFQLKLANGMSFHWVNSAVKHVSTDT